MTAVAAAASDAAWVFLTLCFRGVNLAAAIASTDFLRVEVTGPLAG
jgi:hypothetical protein